MYSFRIEEDGTVTYDANGGIIYDEKVLVQEENKNQTVLPQTGEDKIILGAIMTLTGISIGGAIYYKRKLRKW